MPGGFRMGFRGGPKRRPRGAEAMGVLEREAGPSVRAAGLVLQGGEQKASPVLSGALRADWQTSGVRRVSTALLVTVSNNRVYAHAVDVRGRSAGYIDRGLAASRAEVRRHLAAGARKAVAAAVRGDKS